jgi:hypothetical protein
LYKAILLSLLVTLAYISPKSYRVTKTVLFAPRISFNKPEAIEESKKFRWAKDAIEPKETRLVTEEMPSTIRAKNFKRIT